MANRDGCDLDGHVRLSVPSGFNRLDCFIDGGFYWIEIQPGVDLRAGEARMAEGLAYDLEVCTRCRFP